MSFLGVSLLMRGSSIGCGAMIIGSLLFRVSCCVFFVGGDNPLFHCCSVPTMVDAVIKKPWYPSCCSECNLYSVRGNSVSNLADLTMLQCIGKDLNLCGYISVDMLFFSMLVIKSRKVMSVAISSNSHVRMPTLFISDLKSSQVGGVVIVNPNDKHIVYKALDDN